MVAKEDILQTYNSLSRRWAREWVTALWLRPLLFGAVTLFWPCEVWLQARAAARVIRFQGR